MILPDSLYENYRENLLSGNRNRCQSLVQTLIGNGESVENIYFHLFQRALYDVGKLWEQNKITVATEHMATAITEYLMILCQQELFSTQRIGKRAVIACTANEYHQVGARMVADTFEMHGWDTWFLGSNTPPKDLINLIKDKQPDLLGLSLSIYFNHHHFLRMLNQVREAFPDLPIIYGGQAFRWGGSSLMSGYGNIRHIESVITLKEFIANNPK